MINPGNRLIGRERHESMRIDNQLRGRAGRQGDPGESKFYLFEPVLSALRPIYPVYPLPPGFCKPHKSF